jgi:3-phenylpropionate/cinnamic acid dioxygenase small subunit
MLHKDSGVARNAESASLLAQPDEARYVTPALLAQIEAFVLRSRARTNDQRLAQASLEEVEALLYEEANLLDRREYKQWFNMLSDDFVYWVPSSYQDSSLDKELSINFDDRRRLLDRIIYTESGVQMAQIPKSRTLRTVTNIRAWFGPHSTVEVASNLVIWEYRRNRQNAHVGSQNLILAKRDSGFEIKAKVINLLNCDDPQGNNSFIL